MRSGARAHDREPAARRKTSRSSNAGLVPAITASPVRVTSRPARQQALAGGPGTDRHGPPEAERTATEMRPPAPALPAATAPPPAAAPTTAPRTEATRRAGL